MSQVIGLFPTPLMRIENVLDDALIDAFTQRAARLAHTDNSATDRLSHTQMARPDEDPAFAELTRRVTPHVVQFGGLLFAEALNWRLKELWLNVLQHGGSQFMHTHANSFVSGIVYVSGSHPSANTVFRKNSGGGEFIFRNDVPSDHYASDSYVLPQIEPGDLVLYPSYLLHGVPPNQGGDRITLAFNAIPERLDSLGYRISFGP